MKTLSAATLWLLFMVAVLTDGDSPTVLEGLIAGVSGAVLIGLALVLGPAVEAQRPADRTQHFQYAVRSAAAGLLIGASIVVAMAIIGAFDGEIRFAYARLHPQSWWDPVVRAARNAIWEEVVFRYFAMTAVAWLTLRSKWRDQAYPIALGTTSLLFGFGHWAGSYLLAGLSSAR